MSEIQSNITIKKTINFEQDLDVLNQTSWESFLDRQHILDIMRDLKEINKLMVYYNIADEKDDPERKALVASALVLLSKEEGFKDLYEKMHMGVDPIGLVNENKIKLVISDVKSDSLRDFLSAKLGISVERIKVEPILNVEVKDEAHKNEVALPNLVTQSIVTPKIEVNKSSLAEDVADKMHEYKSMLTNTRSNNIVNKEQEVFDFQTKSSPHMKQQNRPSADFSIFEAKTVDEKISIISQEIMDKLGMTNESCIQMKDNYVATQGMYKIAQDVITQIATVKLDIHNLHIIYKAIDMQVHLILGQVIICKNEGKILGLFPRSLNMLRKIKTKDFNLINAGCELFNAIIAENKNTDEIFELLKKAISVFGYVDPLPAMDFEQLISYDAGIAALIVKRAAVENKGSNILMKLGINLS